MLQTRLRQVQSLLGVLTNDCSSMVEHPSYMRIAGGSISSSRIWMLGNDGGVTPDCKSGPSGITRWFESISIHFVASFVFLLLLEWIDKWRS